MLCVDRALKKFLFNVEYCSDVKEISDSNRFVVIDVDTMLKRHTNGGIYGFRVLRVSCRCNKPL